MGEQHSHSWLVGQQGALGRHCPRALRAQGWAQAAHWGQSLPDCAAQVRILSTQGCNLQCKLIVVV